MTVRLAMCSWLAVLLSTSMTALGQEVVLTSGEVLAGSVTGVTGSRATVRMTAGAVRRVHVRSIDHSVVDGKVLRHAALVEEGPVPESAVRVLEQLRRGAELQVPELMMATDRVSSGLVDALQELAASRQASVRRQAVRALAFAATAATMRLALDAAKDDAAAFGELVAVSTNGAGLAALAECGGLADLEQGLTSRERTTRAASAWLCAKLGSREALPVLAKFVRDSDHHVREMAAVCLAECGDDAGAAVLMAMCRRDQSRAMAANRGADAATRAALERSAHRERVHVIELLGALHHEPAIGVLRKLQKHDDPEIARAAGKALAAIERASGGDGR